MQFISLTRKVIKKLYCMALDFRSFLSLLFLIINFFSSLFSTEPTSFISGFKLQCLPFVWLSFPGLNFQSLLLISNLGFFSLFNSDPLFQFLDLVTFFV